MVYLMWKVSNSGFVAVAVIEVKEIEQIDTEDESLQPGTEGLD